MMKNDKKYFSGIGFRFLIGTIIIFAVQSLAVFLMTKLGENVPAIAENYTYTFLASMLSMYLIGYPITLKLLNKIPAQKIGEKKKMTIGQWFIALFICIAILYFFNIIGQLITSLIGLLKNGSVVNVLGTITGSIHPLANLFIIVICAPFAEELLFRKFLIDRTIQYGELLCVIFSSFVFALYHGNLNQFIYAFPLGLFFAFLYVKTRDIRYSITIHMAVNFLGSFVSQTLMDYSEKLLTIYSTFIVYAMLAGIILFLLFHKRFALQKTTKSGEQVPSFKTLVLNPGMGLYTLFWCVMIIVMLVV